MSRPVYGRSRVVGRAECAGCGHDILGEPFAFVTESDDGELTGGGFVCGDCRRRIDSTRTTTLLAAAGTLVGGL